MSTAYIGRQPIYSPQLVVVGYELLFRNNDKNSAQIIDDMSATTEVMFNAFVEIGLEAIVGNSSAHFKISTDFLDSDLEIPFSPEKVILELLDHEEVENRHIVAIKKLVSEGFRFEVNSCGTDPKPELLEYISIVSIDYTTGSKDSFISSITKLKKLSVLIKASKIETQEEFDFCKNLGIDLFQGYFLSKPKLISQGKIPNNQMAILQLLERLQDPEISTEELEELILRDVSFSYKILKYCNSASVAPSTPIDTISRAITFLGLTKIKQWVTILAVSSISDKPEVLMENALVRSRMCEILAPSMGISEVKGCATAGLFSVLDVLMDRPMEEILEKLPLSDIVRNTLLTYEGPIGEMLLSVVCYEQGNIAYAEFTDVTMDALKLAYIDAIAWEKELHVFI